MTRERKAQQTEGERADERRPREPYEKPTVRAIELDAYEVLGTCTAPAGGEFC